MRVFILGTGRCGTMTFQKAASHIKNFTSGHETNNGRITGRVIYPDNHIEVDNRLSWMTNELLRYEPDVFYVHLKRDAQKTSESFVKRFKYKNSIITTYAQGIFQVDPKFLTESEKLYIAHHYVGQVNKIVSDFIREKDNAMSIDIEMATHKFPEFLNRIGAVCDEGKALNELKKSHNASKKNRCILWTNNRAK